MSREGHRKVRLEAQPQAAFDKSALRVKVKCSSHSMPKSGGGEDAGRDR